MAEGEDGASKTEEASPKKLEDARKKGDVAKTQDMAPLLALTASFGVIATAGGYFSSRMARDLLPFIARPHEINVEGGGAQFVARAAVDAAWPLMTAVLGAAVVAGVFGNLMQHGFLWTTEKLKPEFSKVSPMAGFKRLFGIDGLMQFIKSLLKICIVAAVTWMVLEPRLAQMTAAALLEPAAILPLSLEIAKALFIAVISFMAVTTGADWLWQRFRFLDRQKMTRDEMKQEHKNTEGDPLIKAKLRQQRMERSRRRMMQAVPDATVIIVNPTHYAIALYYVPGETPAPKCVAKGLDAVALKIREIATEAGVPIIEEPPLARALYAAMDIDEFIPPSHYEAVARIIGFIMGKARRPAPRPALAARP